MLIGSPTLDLYVNSWNEKYPSNQIYTAQTTSAMSDGYNGYYVSVTNDPPTTSEYSAYIYMSGAPGYSDTLYYPHTSEWNSCYGYWLASPSAYDVHPYAYEVYYVMYVSCGGNVAQNSSNCASYAFRPVVCLPSSILQ